MWTAVVAAGVGFIYGYSLYQDMNQPQTYKAATSTEAVIVEVEVDVIEKARAELERINQELDVEEAQLLAEKAKIDARLESILETRMSFQSAPEQND